MWAFSDKHLSGAISASQVQSIKKTGNNKQFGFKVEQKRQDRDSLKHSQGIAGRVNLTGFVSLAKIS